MASSHSRRRRCRICHKGFDADPRVGDRQKVCGREACQETRRQETQADWRRRHPGYFIDWRAKKRAELNAKELVEPPRVPPPLSRLPWETFQEEFGVLGADLLAALGRLTRATRERPENGVTIRNHEGNREIGNGLAKDQRGAYSLVTTGKTSRMGSPPAKDEILDVSG